MLLKHHKIDPSYSYAIPILAWQTALKYTGAKLELLRNYIMMAML